MQYTKIKSCPVCFSENSYKLSSTKKQTGYFKEKVTVRLNICNICSFVYQNPRISKEKLDEYYIKSNNSSGKTFFFKKNNSYKYNLNTKRLFFLKKNIKTDQRKKLLEIGASTCDFLNLLDKKEYQLFAIEPTKQKTNKDIKYFNETFEKFKTSQKYEIIACFHTLEHIFDINIFLEKISKILNENGYLFLEVPNSLKKGFYTIEDFYPFEHMSYFNYDNLKFFLSRYGFHSLKVDKTDKTNLRVIAKFNFQRKSIVVNKKKLIDNKNYFIKNYRDYQLKNLQITKMIKKKIYQILNIAHKNNLIVAIYGAGIHTHYLFEIISKKRKTIKHIFDSDIKKKDKLFLNYKIKHFRQLNKTKVDIVLISSVNFENEIYEHLNKVKSDKNLKIIKLYNDLNLNWEK